MKKGGIIAGIVIVGGGIATYYLMKRQPPGPEEPGLELIQAYWNRDTYTPGENAILTAEVKNPTGRTLSYTTTLYISGELGDEQDFTLNSGQQLAVLYTCAVPDSTRAVSIEVHCDDALLGTFDVPDLIVVAPEVYVCPVCGLSFSNLDALVSHLAIHVTSEVNKLFKVSIWAGRWITVWENGSQLTVPTCNLGQRIGITAYYWGGHQVVERLVYFPDGSVKTGYTAGFQTRHDEQGRKYCFTYSLPGFNATQPGAYFGSIKIRGAPLPEGGYSYIDEINVILLKVLPG